MFKQLAHYLTKRKSDDTWKMALNDNVIRVNLIDQINSVLLND